MRQAASVVSMEKAGESDGAVPEILDALTTVRLWNNPCRLSFRINYLANHFNGPVYAQIERRHGLLRPEFIALYSVALQDGVAAKSIVTSSGFPKNTISRAIRKLLSRRLVQRATDNEDRRSFELRLTPAGRRIVEDVVPLIVARENIMLSALSAKERVGLSDLLTRMVVDSPSWLDEPEEEGQS